MLIERILKRAIYTAFILFLLSCSANKNQRFEYNQDAKSLWIDSYKYEVFYGCMQEGLGNDNFKNALKEKDLFNPNASLEFAIINDARKIGALVIKNMPEAYIKIDKGDEYLKKKNFISYQCLRYYASKELDSIANKEYEKFNSNQVEK